MRPGASQYPWSGYAAVNALVIAAHTFVRSGHRLPLNTLSRTVSPIRRNKTRAPEVFLPTIGVRFDLDVRTEVLVIKMGRHSP